MIVFYWLNRLNRLKNQVLCGVAVVANRLNAAVVAVKSVKNGAGLGFLLFAGFLFVKFLFLGCVAGLAANRCRAGIKLK